MALRVNKKISDNCTIDYVDENNMQDNVLITVVLSITFFGKECEAYVIIEDLEKEDARYGMIESDTEVHASLCDILESEEAWMAVKESVREYICYLKRIDESFN